MTDQASVGAQPGPEGRARCGWCLGEPDYLAYHDDEWGRPVLDDVRLYEKISLEGFQSGLSWLTILRKRDSFRQAFAGFDPEAVSRFGAREVDRLLGDPLIVRHRGKIEATIANAKATLAVQAERGSLAALVWSFEPERAGRAAPATLDEIPSVSRESTALAKELKLYGFRFVGPTTAYAAMQSLGLVNDHLVDCHTRAACEKARHAVMVPSPS